jgi:hypothetical protein
MFNACWLLFGADARPEPLSSIERLKPSQQNKDRVAWDAKKVLEGGDITLRVTLSKGIQRV